MPSDHEHEFSQGGKSMLYEHVCLVTANSGHGVPQRVILKQMVRAADDAVTATLAPGSPEWDAYFAVTR